MPRLPLIPEKFVFVFVISPGASNRTFGNRTQSIVIELNPWLSSIEFGIKSDEKRFYEFDYTELKANAIRAHQL